MWLATLIMRLSCNNFKIRKFVERNCKTLCVCVCVCVCVFFGSIYEVIFLLDFYNLSFLMITFKKIPRAATVWRLM